MAKYLQLFDNAADLNAVIILGSGDVARSPWVGAESATHTVRYAPKGIVETEQGNGGSEGESA